MTFTTFYVFRNNIQLSSSYYISRNVFTREKKIGHFCQFLTFESLTTETRSLMEFLRENVCNKEDFLLIVSNFFSVSSYNTQCLALDICKKCRKKTYQHFSLDFFFLHRKIAMKYNRSIPFFREYYSNFLISRLVKICFMIFQKCGNVESFKKKKDEFFFDTFFFQVFTGTLCQCFRR